MIRCNHHPMTVEIIDDATNDGLQLFNGIATSTEGAALSAGGIANRINLVVINVDNTVRLD